MNKYDIVLVDLNPTRGSEQQGIRPCIIIQNNIANSSKIKTITIIPITSNLKQYPYSVIVKGNKKNGLDQDSRIEISQIRTIDRTRIINKIGRLNNEHVEELKEKLISFLDIFDEY